MVLKVMGRCSPGRPLDITCAPSGICDRRFQALHAYLRTDLYPSAMAYLRAIPLDYQAGG